MRGRGRGRGNRDNKDGGRGRGREQPFGKTNVACYRCHKHGHYQSECYTKLPHNKEKWQKSNFTENKEEETLLMVFHTKDHKCKQDVWYLNTGCSNHMCGSKSLFSHLNEEFHTTVSFGDHSKVNVMGKGDIQIRTKKDTIETISNAFYIPDLKSNLLSLGQLQEKGYVTTIKNGACEVYDPTRGLVTHAKMTPNRLFPLQIQTLQYCLMAREIDSTWLWHYRYGHFNVNCLKTFYQKNMVIGLPNIIHFNMVCENCVVGKQHRKEFPQRKSLRAKKVLELVHSDFYGPINSSLNEGKRYFITFIDDCSRKTWVYFLQDKSEACNAFKNFKTHVENEVERTIKILRTNHGGEFCSKEFQDFCDEHGIQRHLTAAYTP
jgi:hypothetical protein